MLSPLAAAADAESPDAPYRVMVVDDSAVIRGFFRRALESDPAIAVVASVGNGRAAIDALRRDPVDVIVLDIEMPVMDGMTALPHLLEADPTAKVVMASTLTAENADISLRALAQGAADYIPKPTTTREIHSGPAFQRELVAKVKAHGLARRARRGETAPGRGPRARPAAAGPAAPPPREIALRPPSALPAAALAIGSSTGGPQALMTLFAGLGAGYAAPVFVTQHMPAAFTGILAEHIGKIAGREAREAADGEAVQPRRIYVAPGDWHMLVEPCDGGAAIRLARTAPENFCRPSVDPMLRSLAALYGRRLLCAMLTGMGHDGLEGARALVAAGGTLIAQDEATSVVWGMPGAVAAAGLCSAVLPIGRIAPRLRELTSPAAAPAAEAPARPDAEGAVP